MCLQLSNQYFQYVGLFRGFQQGQMQTFGADTVNTASVTFEIRLIDQIGVVNAHLRLQGGYTAQTQYERVL